MVFIPALGPSEVEKVSEESQVHDPVSHPFKYPTDRVANINKKISVSIKFPDGMMIAKTGISFTELKQTRQVVNARPLVAWLVQELPKKVVFKPRRQN